MRHLTSFIAGLLLTSYAAHAQCNLTFTYAAVDENCSNAGAPLVMAAWSGGTPPFTLNYTTPGGYWGGTVTSGTFWSVSEQLPPGTHQATFTVTDAMGCVATSSFAWTDHYVVHPQVAPTVDRIVGVTLRWSGMFWISPYQAQPSACSGPFNYQLTNINTSQIWNGTVASDWIAEPNSAWHFGQPLPAGDYFVDIFPANAISSSGYFMCNGFMQNECLAPSSVTVGAGAYNCGTNFTMRAALAGALPSGTLMGDQLRTAGLVPTTEPYSVLGYTYTGATSGATLTPSLLSVSGGNAIVDWVVVELRSASTPGTVLYSRPALIQRDGDVVGLNGSGYINAPLPNGNYYVALRHRNHLGVMTATARPLVWDASSTTIDLRLSSTATYGTNARSAVGPVQCLWSGDAGGNGTVAYTGASNDRDMVLQAIGGSVPTAVVSNVYSSSDINLDGSIRYTGTSNDRDVILQVVGGSLPTVVRHQQLP